MAEVTASFPGGNISYTVVGEPNGSTTINVSTAFGDIVRTNTISSAISTLNANITRSQTGIASINAKISEYNIELSKPDLSPFFRDDYTRQIRTLEKELASTKQYILVNEGAIASINATGQSNIDKATADDNANRARLGLPATPTIDNTTATANAAPTGTNTLQGTASDESGSQPTAPASATTATATGETSVPGTSNSPSTNAPQKLEAERETAATENNTKGTPPYENEAFNRSSASANSRPGKRLKNPLSFMSSYNYQLSLYVITPDAYDAFLLSGRRDVNVFSENIGSSTAAETSNRKGGAFLLAQSGGAGSDPRAPGVKYDYYIDNLSFRHMTSSKSSGAPTGNIEFKFQVTEPYGFSFINNLKQAQKEFERFSEGSAWGTKEAKIVKVPIAKQFFLLGIRFYGWDATGKPVLGTETFEGASIDPDADSTGGLFETFYELTIHSIKYKIDGKATVYNLEGNVTGASLGSNTKRGIINSSIEVSGATVRDVLSGPNGLITKLNKEQQDLKNNKSVEYPIVYSILWQGSDAERIAIASVTSEARQNKSNQPGTSAKNTQEVNDSTGVKATPNKTQENIVIGNRPIIQAIDDIFSRSSYVEDALSFNYTDSDEFDPKTKSKKTESTPKKPFRWYRITPTISNPNWDNLLNDWAYDITYVIETYKMPVIDSPFAVATDKYYGPHKRYDYWYTGENSEVLSYTQELNNQYHNEVPAGDPSSKKTEDDEGNAQQTSSTPNTTKSIDLTGAGGGLETAAAGGVKNVLYDPGSYTSAKVQILGDPDFLMQESGTGTATLNKAYDRHYETENNPFSIRPTGGQVFIEIDFKEAVDYSANDVNDVFENGEGITGVGGTLSINDSILFWDYPKGARDVVKGISYEVTSVESMFRNGMFTQTIDAVINDFGTGAKTAGDEREDGSGNTSISGEEEQAVSRGEALEDKAVGTAKDVTPGAGKPTKTQSTTPVAKEPTT